MRSTWWPTRTGPRRLLSRPAEKATRAIAKKGKEGHKATRLKASNAYNGIARDLPRVETCLNKLWPNGHS